MHVRIVGPGADQECARRNQDARARRAVPDRCRDLCADNPRQSGVDCRDCRRGNDRSGQQEILTVRRGSFRFRRGLRGKIGLREGRGPVGGAASSSGSISVDGDSPYRLWPSGAYWAWNSSSSRRRCFSSWRRRISASRRSASAAASGFSSALPPGRPPPGRRLPGKPPPGGSVVVVVASVPARSLSPVSVIALTAS